MRPRLLPLLLLLAAAPALAGDAGPEADPFLAALAGKSGPDAVAAPSFDPDAEAFSWTLRPRREIVDGLAARLLRGEAKGWFEPAKEVPALPAPPSRIPADFDAGKFEIADRLAARVPADAAAAFFGSLTEAEDAVDGLAKFLPAALPGLCGDPPGGKRDALRRAIEMLLLPTIWRSNPGVRTGTRQIAVVASDPDLRWAPDVALVAEVDDASLVRFHRQSSLSWEDRGKRHLRVDGLDAVADDGSVRSYFALEGGVAVWSTTKSLRDRILAAASGKAPTLLSPDPRAYALARRTFPAAEGGALLVVPDGFLARISASESRARRAAALRCVAARLVLDVRGLAKQKVSSNDTIRLSCPAGGEILPATGSVGSSCSVHGSAAFPTPLGALPTSVGAFPPVEGDLPSSGALPVAALWNGVELRVLVPAGSPGARLMTAMLPSGYGQSFLDADDATVWRLGAMLRAGYSPKEIMAVYGRMLGVIAWPGEGQEPSMGPRGPSFASTTRKEMFLGCKSEPVFRASGGILALMTPTPGPITGGGCRATEEWILPFEWR